MKEWFFKTYTTTYRELVDGELYDEGDFVAEHHVVAVVIETLHSLAHHLARQHQRPNNREQLL